MKCLYCGNLSGKIDHRGNCISCGAPLNLQISDEITIDDTFSNYIKTIEEEEPIEYYKNKNEFTDFDNLESYFKKYITGSLKNYFKSTKELAVDQIYNK